MRALVLDPQGPAWPHVLAQLAAVAIAIAPAFVTIDLLVPSLLAGGFLLFATPLWRLRQRDFRPAELRLTPGELRITGAGLRSQRITARKLVGASTARAGSRVLLSLMQKGRDMPTTLDLESEAEAERICRALGVGHGGFGDLSFTTAAPPIVRQAFIARIVGALTILAISAALASDETGLLILVGVCAYPILPLCLVLSMAALARSAPFPQVRMGPGGLQLEVAGGPSTVGGPFGVPYAAVSGVRHGQGERIGFDVPEPWRHVEVKARRPGAGAGMTAADFRVLEAQLASAHARATGRGRSKDEVAFRIDTLRSSGEAGLAWLARLDATGQTLGAQAGYRGQSLEPEDLWRVLEDPDADPEIRGAATRVLRNLPGEETRVRIDAAVAAVRDETTMRSLARIADDDRDAASSELTRLAARSRSGARTV